MKSLQRGAFLVAQAFLVVLILLAMLIIPIWIKRGNDDKMNAGMKAEQAKNAFSPNQRPPTSVGAPVTAVAEAAPVAGNLDTGSNGAQGGAPVTDVPRTVHCGPGRKDCQTGNRCAIAFWLRARQKELMVDEECKEKRLVLSERHPRLASLSREEKKPFHRRN